MLYEFRSHNQALNPVVVRASDEDEARHEAMLAAWGDPPGKPIPADHHCVGRGLILVSVKSR